MAIFYAPDILETGTLNEEESNHCVKVLRMKAGDDLEIVDGIGNYYKAKISNPHHKKCAVDILETISEYSKRNYKVHLAIAPTKNIDRLEWFAEKATEIGVDEISILICDHSERKVVKNDRLEKILVSAMKQSKKAYLPRLNEQVSFTNFMKQDFGNSRLFICHCIDQDKKILSHEYHSKQDAVILIGPEGDFSEDEVEKAINKGFVPVSLGESRLRTETAGVAAVHTISIINELNI